MRHIQGITAAYDREREMAQLESRLRSLQPSIVAAAEQACAEMDAEEKEAALDAAFSEQTHFDMHNVPDRFSD